ncbi:MAG TPA: carboxypeptidase M32 [Chlamydiales bacterium]|nr:carboxypeptidase M32 [Chlamydiales bacterium]
MAKDPQKNFENFLETSKNLALVSSTVMLLNWDQETYMPQGGIDARSAQIALLTSYIHKERTSSSYKKALSSMIHLPSGKYVGKKLNPVQKIALREWRHDFLRDNKLPNSFVKSFAELTSVATNAWSQAKKKRSFKEFSPYLKKIVEMVREKADILGYKKHPYDALIDLHEKGMTAEKLDHLFAGLKKALQPLLKKVTSKKGPDDSFLYGEFSPEKQREFGKKLIHLLGTDPHHFRLDESAHPFSMAVHPSDVRITTRILPDSVMSNILAILHECGHAFYEMGLPKEYYGSPICEAASLGIHESQSRWWETRIGRSKGFWKFLLPHLQKEFPEKLKKVPFETFYKGLHVVTPSFIRIEADEMTYSFHVILRYELEKALLTKELKVDDLPSAWNELSKKLLGITPKHDAEGCLQDIHWSMGELGYFPTYTLGNLYASHFFTTFAKENPDWETRLQKGEFDFCLDWLKKNIHQYGRTYAPEELAERVTGKSLTEKAYVDYLTDKYSEIYS